MKTIGRMVLFLALISVPARGGDEHNHEAAVEPAPHGGTLRDSGDFKAELVLNGEVARLYVYNKQLKALAPEKDKLSGMLRFPKQKERKIEFKKAKEYYEANLAGIAKVHRYDLHVNLEHGGKKALADFGIDNVH